MKKLIPSTMKQLDYSNDWMKRLILCIMKWTSALRLWMRKLNSAWNSMTVWQQLKQRLQHWLHDNTLDPLRCVRENGINSIFQNSALEPLAPWTLFTFTMECERLKENLLMCNCTYEPCARKGRCCECIAYHLKSRQLPACAFPPDVEKTFNRSFKAFIATHK